MIRLIGSKRFRWLRPFLAKNALIPGLIFSLDDDFDVEVFNRVLLRAQYFLYDKSIIIGLIQCSARSKQIDPFKSILRDSEYLVMQMRTPLFIIILQQTHLC